MFRLLKADYDMAISAAAAKVALNAQGNSVEAKQVRLAKRFKEKYGDDFR
jgi:hypothetical protein